MSSSPASQNPICADGSSIQLLRIADVDFTPAIITRDRLDMDTVERYRLSAQRGEELPPALVYFDGRFYHGAGGRHRGEALRKLNREFIAFVGQMSLNVGVLMQANVNFDITGGTGRDEVDIFTSVAIGNRSQNSTFNMNAELGSGSDFFGYNIFQLDVDSNSALSVRASGGSGNDVLGAQYALVQLSELKGLAQFDFLGGVGNDQLISRFADVSGQLPLLGELRVNMDGQDGIDTLETSLNVTAASTGNYSLVAKGGAGKDTFVLGLQTNGAALTYGLAGTLVIDGGLGIDTFRGSIPAAIIDIQSVETFV